MGDKPFSANLWGVVLQGGLMVALCKGRENITNAFSSNLKTINPKVFPKHGGIGFILEVNSEEVLNVVSYSVTLMLTLAWSIDILFEKLTPETGVEFERHPLHTPPLGVGDFMQTISSFLTSFVVTCTLMPCL